MLLLSNVAPSTVTRHSTIEPSWPLDSDGGGQTGCRCLAQANSQRSVCHRLAQLMPMADVSFFSFDHTTSGLTCSSLCLIAFVHGNDCPVNDVTCRPRSMRGGDLHWIWKPYSLYQDVDLVYGMKAIEQNNGFTSAQGMFQSSISYLGSVDIVTQPSSTSWRHYSTCYTSTRHTSTLAHMLPSSA